MVKSIFLQDGEEIFVDDEDFERINKHLWYKTYPNFKRYKSNSRSIFADVDRKKILLTTFIENGCYQKIKNNDFTRKNLTTRGNKYRWQMAKVNSSSRYKGVSWAKDKNKWTASIVIDGKTKYLGRYKNEDDAARAYNQAVIDYWNGDGYLNVIGEDNRLRPKNLSTKRKQNLKGRKNLTKYKGLYKDKSGYSASIYYDKKNYIGYQKDKRKAALIYNKCAIYLHGDEAILNDVPMTDELKEFISNWKIPEKIKRLKDEANEYTNQNRE